jgi:23S rRNA (adenine2503-C2)-methyltransferase
MSDAVTLSPPPEADTRPSFAGLGRAAFAAEMARLAAKPFRANQLWTWVYVHGARSFDDMSSLSRVFREELARHYTLLRPEVAAEEHSADGTRKWLVRLGDGKEVEAVYIPESDRGTLCVSSQVGCTLNCSFCHTGTQRLVRNLEAHEIVAQVMVARDALDEWSAPPGERRITNIVMMGMGEPLYNLDNVTEALHTIMDPAGLAFSRRRITLSTAGVVPLMERCGTELGVNLAISLHAVTDVLRDELVPINRKYPIAKLLDACRHYPGARNARRITFEYVMLDGVNDSPSDAKELARLLRGIPSKVNLIPFNPWPGAPYGCSDAAVIQRFAGIVNDAGYVATVRAPRGRDIHAACGQLRTASERERRRGRVIEGGREPAASEPT